MPTRPINPKRHEDAYYFQLKAAGLPLPQREYMFYPGRRFRADFDWVRGHQLPLLTEVEGGIFVKGRHQTPLGFRRDCEKYNLAVSLGLYVLRFTPDMIEEGIALDITERVLHCLMLRIAA